MKKLFFLLFILLIIPQLDAKQTIHEYLEDVDEYYYLVLGAKSPAGDSSAGIDIALGIQTYNKIIIRTEIEGNETKKVSKILIGHPCENSLIELSCDKWPYEEGIGVIKIIKNNLVISGTTVDDRRRAAKIIADYPNYQELKDNFFVIVKGNTLIVQDLEVEKAKIQSEFVCGDTICEPGEKFLCFVDCGKKTCNDICNEGKFREAKCRQIIDPKEPVCKENEVNKGQKYCTGERFCCCEKNTEKKEVTKEPEKIVIEVIKEPESKQWVIGAVIALVAILLTGYLLLRR